MNRQGVALFVALVVVLVGGLVVALASAIAASEIRAGHAWLEQAHSVALGLSAAARARPVADSLVGTLAAGGAMALSDTVRLRRLTDSTALLAILARSRTGEEAVTVWAWIRGDSTASSRLRLPPSSRVRYRPVP